MLYAVEKSFGTMVPFVNRASLSVSTSKLTKAIPGGLKPITHRVNALSPALESPIRARLHAKPINVRKIPKDFICYPTRFFTSLPVEKLSHHLLPNGVKKFMGLAATFHDSLHGPVSPDEVELYQKVIKPEDSTLIIGSGTENWRWLLRLRAFKLLGLSPLQIC